MSLKVHVKYKFSQLADIRKKNKVMVHQWGEVNKTVVRENVLRENSFIKLLSIIILKRMDI